MVNFAQIISFIMELIDLIKRWFNKKPDDDNNDND